jgi:hypothetical protein
MMMTPQEKAKQLYGKYYGIPLYIKTVKECCHIAVNEIIASRKDDIAFNDTNWENASKYYTPHPMYLNYWLKVKEEIDKL